MLNLVYSEFFSINTSKYTKFVPIVLTPNGARNLHQFQNFKNKILLHLQLCFAPYSTQIHINFTPTLYKIQIGCTPSFTTNSHQFHSSLTLNFTLDLYQSRSYNAEFKTLTARVVVKSAMGSKLSNQSVLEYFV